jgi:hypothetical protein
MKLWRQTGTKVGAASELVPQPIFGGEGQHAGVIERQALGLTLQTGEPGRVSLERRSLTHDEGFGSCQEFGSIDEDTPHTATPWVSDEAGTQASSSVESIAASRPARSS